MLGRAEKSLPCGVRGADAALESVVLRLWQQNHNRCEVSSPKELYTKNSCLLTTFHLLP